MLLTYWLNFLHAQRVAFYMSRIDSATFMGWREQGIEGVANIPGC
ncbi:UNVERIFIED_ORG: hypothetical protein ABIC54_004440 [Burkholderia sp. 1263]